MQNTTEHEMETGIRVQAFWAMWVYSETRALSIIVWVYIHIMIIVQLLLGGSSTQIIVAIGGQKVT